MSLDSKNLTSAGVGVAGSHSGCEEFGLQS